MKILHKSLCFIKLVALLSDKLNELVDSPGDVIIAFEFRFSTFTLEQFLYHLRMCSADLISAEIIELCLSTTQITLFFKLFDSQVKHTASQIGNIQRQWNRYDFRHYFPPEQYTRLDGAINTLSTTCDNVLETTSRLRLFAGVPDSLPDIPPSKPHFNRYAIKTDEPGKLHTLLIRHKLIHSNTQPETTAYIFYGIGSPSSWQPVTWLETVADLSYFIDMFFGISDQRNKWRTAHDSFRDKRRHKFNYNSLRGKQYNYLSNRSSKTLHTIDHIRRELK